MVWKNKLVPWLPLVLLCTICLAHHPLLGSSQRLIRFNCRGWGWHRLLSSAPSALQKEVMDPLQCEPGMLNPCLFIGSQTARCVKNLHIPKVWYSVIQKKKNPRAMEIGCLFQASFWLQTLQMHSVIISTIIISDFGGLRIIPKQLLSTARN